MRKFAALALVVSAMSAVAAPSIAFAQDGAAVVAKRGAMLYSADGKRVTNVYRVNDNGDAMLIYNGKMITVEASTLSEKDGKLVTSLTTADIRAIR